jgi:hypothetical protein
MSLFGVAALAAIDEDVEKRMKTRAENTCLILL